MKEATDIDRANSELVRQRGADINWENEVDMTTKERPGVVLTVQVYQKASVYEARWTTGHVSRRAEWKEINYPAASSGV